MNAPDSLPASLLRHAAERPEAPWLFRAEGCDWAWHPFGEMAAWMAVDGARVAALAGDGAVAVPFRAEPAWVTLDLALQAAGRVALPGSGPPSADGAVLPELPPRPAYEAPHRRFGAVAPRERFWRQVRLPGQPASPAGAAVRDAAGAHVIWSAGELLEAGRALGREVERRAGPPPKGREILVWCGPGDDPEARALLAWATEAGAALALEPDPAALVATAYWVRPTFFQGSGADLAALRQWVQGESPRRWFRRSPALPLRRLRAVRCVGAEPLAEEDLRFWRSRGVEVIAAERRSRGI